MKSMAKKLLLLCCILALCLTGCSEKASTVKYIPLTEQEASISQMVSDSLGIFQFTYAGDVQGYVLRLDTWFQSKRIRSDVLSYGGAEEETLSKLYLATKIARDENERVMGTQWLWKEEMETENTAFVRNLSDPLEIPFPDTWIAENFAWGFDYWRCEQKTTIEPNQSYALAAVVCDLFGDGIRTYEVATLVDDLSALQGNDGNEYMQILYLDTYASAQEAEAAAKAV